MKTLAILGLVFGFILSVSTVVAQNAAPPARCECCGKVLGKEVAESRLSSDPDFKAHGMFQTCKACMDRKMDAGAQRSYEQVALKYKWNSIAHNKCIAYKASQGASRLASRKPTPREPAFRGLRVTEKAVRGVGTLAQLPTKL